MENTFEEICDYFESLLEKDRIQLENVLTRRTTTRSINKLIENLIEVINPGTGYYSLNYNNKKSKKVFYDDSTNRIKGNDTGVYCFEDIDERNIWIEEKYETKVFKFKTNRDYLLFWYTVCEQKIPYRYPFSREIVPIEFANIVKNCEIDIDKSDNFIGKKIKHLREKL